MDWKRLGPIALAALLVSLLPLRLSPGATKGRDTAPTGSAAVEENAEELSTLTAFELLAEYAGSVPVVVDGKVSPDFLPPNTRLEFLIATLPDPLDTTLALDFDLALDGLQRGFAAELYLLDRFHLPWHHTKAEKHHSYRREPGVMLFRRMKEKETLLRLVFLVGETPRQGIHAAAFDLAIAAVRALAPTEDLPPLQILGPYFSGSAESLARGLWRARTTGARVVTGSATASGLDAAFARVDPSASFDRTVPEDEVLLDRTLCALQKRLLLPSRKSVALLVEADTAYGANIGAKTQDPSLSCGLEPLVVRFSGRLSSLRTALGRRVKEEEYKQGSKNEVDVSRRRETELELDLAAPGKAVDVVQELSPDTADLDDLALASLIRNLSREGYRFVGLLSTDSMDKLYLGWRLRQLAPDLLLFTFNNSLLYAHPEARRALEGTLVLTSTPLVAERPGANLRQQLATETQSGILRATRALLELDATKQQVHLTAGRQTGWVVAVGGGALWPIVSEPLDDGAGQERPGPEGVRGSPRVLLALGFFLAALGFGAAWLHRTSPPKDLPTASCGEPAWQVRWLLAGGLSVLAFAAWVALVVAALPWSWLAKGGWHLPTGLLALAVLFTAGTAVALRIAARVRGREMKPIPPRALPGGERTWVPLGSLALAGSGWLLVQGWTGGQIDPQFFYQRALTLSSGLSPLVSLTFIGGGMYCWFLLQQKRLRTGLRHGVPFPEPALAEGGAELHACARLARENVSPLLRGVFPPTSRARFWVSIGALVAIVGASGLLVRPLAETAGYGLWFGALVFGLAALAAISWYRFLTLWRELQRVLGRLPKQLLAELDGRSEELVAAIDWNPMRSFAWTMSEFRMSQLAAETIVQRSTDPNRREAVRAAHKAVLEAEGERDFTRETQARWSLQRVLTEVDGEAATAAWGAYHVFRFAAYLRFVFEVLRSQLLTTVSLGLAALGAVSFYDYHPRYLFTLAVSVGLVAVALSALLAFYQMETNPVLSKVAGVDSSKVSSWRHLLLNVLSYVLFPLLALLASRIPLIGELLRQIGNPMLQGLGGS